MSRLKFPVRTDYYYQRFVDNANKTMLHHNDYRDFYRFIHAAHLGRTKIAETDLNERLRLDGFSKEMSFELSVLYQHGRDMLRTSIGLGNDDEWKK